MPIEKKPKKLVPKNCIPPNFQPYKVKDGEGWRKIAKRHRMDVWELIYENFKTRDPAETNWYLRNYVGCVKETVDKKNWMFSSNAEPGIIYVPVQRIDMPPMYIEGKVPSKLKNVWAGLGKSHSGDLFVVGAHDLTAMVYNLGDELPDVRNAVVNINGYKLGAGLGGSVGAVFVIAHGYQAAREMYGVSGSWDFDVSIGAKLGDFLKGVKGLGKAVDTIQKYKKMRYLTENAIKNIGITKPGVYSIPIPLAGIGLHLWGGYKFGDVTILRTGKGIF
jgi:hypothetical protein